MFGAYQRWCRTTSTRAQYFEKFLEMCDMVDDPECPKAGKHRDMDKANIRKCEEAVEETKEAIASFLNPFRLPVPEDPSEDRLYALHSGAPVSLAVEKDVMRADALGEQQKLNFIEQRLKNKEKHFFDTITRQNLLTMDHASKKVTISTSQGKVHCFIHNNVISDKINMHLLAIPLY